MDAETEQRLLEDVAEIKERVAKTEVLLEVLISEIVKVLVGSGDDDQPD